MCRLRIVALHGRGSVAAGRGGGPPGEAAALEAVAEDRSSAEPQRLDHDVVGRELALLVLVLGAE